MKLLLLSDPHFYSDKYGLLDLKLKRTVQVVANHPEVDWIVITGDTQHNRYYDIQTVVKEAGMWNQLFDLHDRVIIVSGNHDLSKDTLSPILPYILGTNSRQKGITFVGRWHFTLQDKFYIQGWCHKDKLPIPLEPDAIYLGHLKINEWTHSEDGKALAELQSSKFKVIFTGDCHEPKQDGKVVSVGTAFPTSFQDSGIEGGYVILDESGNYERFEVKDYPVFHVIEIHQEVWEGRPVQNWLDLERSKVMNNIVRLDFHGHADWIKEVRPDFVRLAASAEPFAKPKYREFVDGKTVKTYSLSPNSNLIQEFGKDQGWTREQIDKGQEFYDNAEES